MNHLHRIARVLVATCLATVAARESTGGIAVGEDPPVPNQALFRMTPGVPVAVEMAALAQQFPGTTLIGEIPSRETFKVQVPRGTSPAALDNALQQHVAAGALVWGELNYEGQAAEGKSDSIWISQLSIGAQQYLQQYSVPLLGLPAAQRSSQGQGVLVAVLDTGVDFTHPALAAAQAPGGASFVAGAGLGDEGDGLDTDGDGTIDEMVGHGTFVAGCVLLVAPQAKIVSVTVLDSEGIGDTFSIAQGLCHAIDRGVQVINCSFGSTYKGAAVEDAVLEAVTKGIVVVGAAGNLDQDDPKEFPALVEDVLGVGATDDMDIKAPFSNFHDKLALCAPGDSKLAAPGVPDPARSVIGTLPGGGYGVWSGTSFSTGFVSGAAALVRAQHPGAPGSATTVTMVSSAILGAATPIDALNPAYEGQLGDGRLDVAAAVAAGPPAPTTGDLDGDGHVDGADLGMLLSVWGPCPPGGAMCVGDANLDGTIDGADLGAMLAAWG